MALRVLFRLLPWLLVFVLGWWLVKKLGLLQPDEPKVQVTHNTLVTDIVELGRLELVRYSFKDIVEYKKEYSRFLPDSKAVLIVEGEAVGCLDLTQVKPEHIITTGDTLTLLLPEPELCSYKVDHSKSRVFHREYTYFNDVELAEEAYRYAEENIRNSAVNSGILKQTRLNAQKILKPMLEKMSGKTVLLEYRNASSVSVPQPR